MKPTHRCCSPRATFCSSRVGRHTACAIPCRIRDPYTFQMPQADPGGRCQFLRVGGRAPSTSFVCGAFIFSHANHPLLTMLPRFMYLRSGKQGHEILTRSIIKSLIAEVTNMQPGSETVISRLMDLFFIHALRTWLSQQPQGSAWLKAVNDQRIGRHWRGYMDNPSESGPCSDSPPMSACRAPVSRCSSVSLSGSLRKAT